VGVQKLWNPEEEESSKAYGRGFYTVEGDIEEGSLADIRTALLKRELLRSREPVVITVNSPGGDLAETWGLIDVMEAVSYPVCTVGLGQAKSAGAMIVAAGTRGMRLVGKRTEIVVHMFLWSMDDNYHQLMAAGRGIELERERFEKFWLRHTGLKSLKEVRKKLLRPSDVYLSAKEAKKLGIVDDILSGKRLRKLWNQ